jgi:hypothetical protein
MRSTSRSSVASAESAVAVPRTARSTWSCSRIEISSHSGTLGQGAVRSSCAPNARILGSATSAESRHASVRAGRSPLK